MKEHMSNKKGHTTLMSYLATIWKANAFFKKKLYIFHVVEIEVEHDD
jgi:hypothetical protein